MRIAITGATGLVGSALLQHLAREHPEARFTVLVRSLLRWRALAPSLNLPAHRITAVHADLRASIDADLRAVDLLIHCAADTSFSRELAESRALNTGGTARLIDLAQRARVRRFAYVSTAFVAGTRTGRIPADLDAPPGWVNAYEQSKYEAELLVRRAQLDWVVFRPATIVCDDEGGRVSQYNSVHRALHLCQRGLAALLSGAEDSPVDLVTNQYVVRAIARIALQGEASGQTYHLCAGPRAIRLGELLDRCFVRWRQDAEWRRRGIARPALTDLATYRHFERSIYETADQRLRAITRALGFFAPQLCYAKEFDTGNTARALGFEAAAPVSYLDNMLASLEADHWTTRSAA